MTEKKERQKIRFNEAELNLIKLTFLDNEALLKILRKIFLQMPLSQTDKDLIKINFEGKHELLKLVRKVFIPEIDAEAPFHQVVDLWMTIDLKDKTPEECLWQFKARKKLIDLLEDGFNRVKNVDIEPEYIFDGLEEYSGKVDVDAYTDMVARNTLIGHTEMQIAQLYTMAEQTEATEEEIKKRVKKDSAK